MDENEKLTILSCDNNPLKKLKVDKNINLLILSCCNNGLTELDVSNNTKVWNLLCYTNNLTTLDLSKNVNLEQLWCWDNQLSHIDLSMNSLLSNFKCKNNQLTSLDLRNCPKLHTFLCENNHLTSIDLRKNGELVTVYGDNQTYAIEVNEDTLAFDLNKLPPVFDPSKASHWEGATVSDTTLNLDPSKPTEVKYWYEGNPEIKNWSSLTVTLFVTYVKTPPQPKDILIPCPYGAVICPTQPTQTIPLTPVPVQQKTADDVQAQVAQLPKTGEQEPTAVAFSSLLLLSLGAFLIISRKK